MSYVETDVSVDRVLAVRPEEAAALENDLRAAMLELLAEERAVEGLHAALRERGFDQAETTVRHHLDVLQTAGLVERSRLEEAGGGVRKYYRATARYLPYALDAEVTTDLSDAATVTRAGLSALLDSLRANHADAIAAAASEVDADDPDRAAEFLVHELVGRALVDLAAEGALDELSSRS